MPAVRDAGVVSGKGGALSAVAGGPPSLARDERNFFTRAAADAEVYGEFVRRDAQGARWRRWDPHRSKVAAALHRGGLTDGLEFLVNSSSLLYLGAASGTTVSHLADIVSPRPVFAVEFATRSFQDLIENLRPWSNVLPIHGDARRPASYRAMVGEAGGIVQDVAQPGQVEILAANASTFLHEGAWTLLFLKARSEDSSKDPETIFARARRDLDEAGFSRVHDRPLDPYDSDHRAFMSRWDG